MTCAAARRASLRTLVERLRQAAAHERSLARQQGVKNRAQAVDIGRRGERSPLPGCLLGAMYEGFPRVALSGSVRSRARCAGQAEVGDVRLAALVKQDVCRLEVAVQDAPLVRMVNGLGDRGHQPGRRHVTSAANSPRLLSRLLPRTSFMLKSAGPPSGPPRKWARCAGGRDSRRPRPRSEEPDQLGCAGDSADLITLRATSRLRAICRAW